MNATDDLPPPPPNPDDNGPRRGRPPKITEDIVLGIAQGILDGNFKLVAARRYGISPRTFQRWMKLGLKWPGSLYDVFRRMVMEAEAEAERIAVKAVYQSGQFVDQKHMQWWLERKFPQRWGRSRGELAELLREMRELREEIAELKQGDSSGETPDFADQA